jgi:hypothetical protein
MGTKKMLHDLDMQSAQRLVNLPDPSAAQHAATKAYVDNVALGINNLLYARARTTGNITIANPGTAVFDGVTLSNGEILLVDQQSTASQDGLYVFNGSGVALTRTTSLPAGDTGKGLAVLVGEGTVNGNQLWIQTAEPAVINTDGLTFSALAPGITYTADGNGIEVSAQVFSLELDGTTLSKSSAGVRVGSGAAGAGLVESSGVLAVGDGGEGVVINADDVSLDFATVGRWRTWVGAASAGSTIVQAHGLGKSTNLIQVWENTTGSTWRDITDGVIIEQDATNVTVDFGASQADRSKFRIMLLG